MPPTLVRLKNLPDHGFFLLLTAGLGLKGSGHLLKKTILLYKVKCVFTVKSHERFDRSFRNRNE